MDKKISVIIPAYNCENTLPETLDCILGQSAFNEAQIIIINDGSGDSTGEKAAAFAEKYDNVIYFEQSNAGVSAARNKGLEFAAGKYVIFIDSDDLISGRDALKNLTEAMETSGADAGIFRLKSFGCYGSEYNEAAEKLSKEKEISRYDKRLLWNYTVSNKIYKTELIKANDHRFPDTVYTEDGAFWISFIMKYRPKIIGIDSAVSEYRQENPIESMQATQNIKLKTVQDFIRSSEIISKAITDSFDDPGCECEDKEGYLKEQKLRICQMLLNGFYRKLWLTDDETLAYIGNKYNEYLSQLDEEAKARLESPDLTKPYFTKREAAEHPLISVKVKNPSKQFVNSLYSQTTPAFEICTGTNIYRENVNHSKPRSRLIIKFGGKNAADPRLLSGILKINRAYPSLPSCLLRPLAEFYLKHKENL